jgi:hypothetical protein
MTARIENVRTTGLILPSPLGRDEGFGDATHIENQSNGVKGNNLSFAEREEL